MKFPTYKEMGEKAAKEALDTFEYNGKTLREWIEIIASNDGDTISRKAAIETAKKMYVACDTNSIDDYEMLMEEALKALPSAEPKRGEWIHNGSQWKNRWICSECGYMYYLQQPNFCPNCGADMRGERNEP